MTNRYSHNTGDYECILCDKKYARKFTLERHIVSIHGFSWDDYLKEICANTTTKECNNTEDKHVIYNHTQNTSVTHNTENVTHMCTKCNKKFSRQWNLNRHKNICKGIIDRFACEYCFKKFKHKDSRCKHLKICKTKKEFDAKSLSAATSNTSNNVASLQIADTINNTNNQTQRNEVNENTNSTIYTSCDDNIPKKGIVYFIQPHELVGTDRYKIGCSSNNSLERLKAYRKGTRIILVYDCYNPFDIEKIIKLEFNKSFTLISGTEIFRGNESDMKLVFINILLDIK